MDVCFGVGLQAASKQHNPNNVTNMCNFIPLADLLQI
jgi:hypothetical protein